MGSMLFAALALSPELDRNYIREKTLEGQQPAAWCSRSSPWWWEVGGQLATLEIARREASERVFGAQRTG